MCVWDDNEDIHDDAVDMVVASTSGSFCFCRHRGHCMAVPQEGPPHPHPLNLSYIAALGIPKTYRQAQMALPRCYGLG